MNELIDLEEAERRSARSFEGFEGDRGRGVSPNSVAGPEATADWPIAGRALRSRFSSFIDRPMGRRHCR